MVPVGKCVLLLGLTVGCVTGCGGSPSDKAGGKTGKPVVLTLANAMPNSLELDAFARNVASLSGGTLRIEFKSRWRLGQTRYETGLIRDVGAGRADLGWSGSRAFDSVGVTSLRALAAPLLIDSYALEEKVVSSPIAAQMLQGLQLLELVGLGILPGAMRKPLGITGPLVKPGDYAGMTVGSQQSRVADATFRALGAKPVWFPVMGDISRFDGIEQQIGAIRGNGYEASGRFLTANVDLWPRPLVLFANRKVFDHLTAQQQSILRRAVTAASPDSAAMVVRDEREAAGVLCRARSVTFVTAGPQVLAALRRAVQPVYDDLERDAATRRAIGIITAMRATGTGSNERSPACGAAVPAASRSAPLDGVYQSVARPADLRAAGTPAADMDDQTWTQTIVIDRGHFAATYESRRICTWGYGTLDVQGQTFRQRVVRGGGKPAKAANQPGEEFGFHWSRYRGTVTLSALAGAVSPPPAMAKPLRLISATPSRRFFAKRCAPPQAALPD